MYMALINREENVPLARMGSNYLVKAILAISLEDPKSNPTYTPDQSHRDSHIFLSYIHGFNITLR